MIVLTDTATTKVEELLEAEDQPELSLRVAVRPGGCSGLSYEMFFDSEKAPDDIERGLRRCPLSSSTPRAPSTSSVRRSTTRTASRAPGSRSTTRTRSAPAVAASRSPERIRREAEASWSRSRVDDSRSRVTATRSKSSRAGDESLLLVLRERLGIVSAKDGCAPQGQCGCCTVLVDGEPRVACVTPVTRVEGRAVTTVEGLDAAARDAPRRRSSRRADRSAGSARPASSCAFAADGHATSTAAGRAPVPVHRLAHRVRRDRAAVRPAPCARSRRARRARAALEGGGAQARRALDIPLGGAPFADDTAPRDALVAVPLPPGSSAESVQAAGMRLGRRRLAARGPRRVPAKVQGRRTTAEARDRRCSTALPPMPRRRGALATSWVEPAYLEPDASWCTPGGEPASPLANGGAFGGKEHSLAPRRCARARRSLRTHGAGRVRTRGRRAARAQAAADRGGRGRARRPRRDRRGGRARWYPTRACGPSPYARGRRALARGRRRRSAGECRPARGRPRRTGRAGRGRARRAHVDVVDPERSHAPASASTVAATRSTGRRGRLAAGDPLDETVLRSYAIGAAHMALGWVRYRIADGRSRDGRGARPHDSVVRHPARDGHAAGRRCDRRRRCTAARSRDRRRVRRGRGRQRGTRCPRRGMRPDTFPARDDVRASSQEVSDAGCPPFPRRTRRRLPGRTHRRCAPATGWCSPARSGSIPRRGKMAEAGSKRRPAKCSRTSRPCSATAG